MKIRSTPKSRWAGAPVLAGIALFASACGGGGVSVDAGVASLDDSAPSATAEAQTTAADTAVEAPENPEDAFALFNQCMTDAGFGFGEAISINGSGDALGGAIAVDIGGTNPGEGQLDPQEQVQSFEDFDFEEFEEANDSCEGHDDAQLDWTDCMREQGVEVPDFDGAGSGTIVIEQTVEGADPQSGVPSFDDSDFNFENFEAAADICQSVYDEYDELDGLFEGIDE